MATDADTIELRGNTPKSVVAVLDAVSLVRNKPRWELINEILEAYAEDKKREATAILRVAMEGKR